ncbi:MAG: methyltransferase [Alistipes sp.]|nr:methyltransferase [Candidatus Minthomonas equi]
MTEEQFEEGYFTFKQFRVKQKESAMKVGTDAVLLGSWMTLPTNTVSRLLDIGTGTGVISLLVAQRLSLIQENFDILAVEPDLPSFREAVFNFTESSWNERICAVNDTFQHWAVGICADSFDCIFSNPPYFVNSLPAPDHRRSSARHADMLPFDEITRHSIRLLKPGGTLSVILPPEESRTFSKSARGCFYDDKTLVPSRICHVHPSPGKPVKRCIMEFICKKNHPVNSPLPEAEVLILQDGFSLRSAQYSDLTKMFYVR